MIKEKPILFNTEMVRAILDGRKTQTRRVVDLKKYPQYPDKLDSLDAIFSTFPCQSGCPFGQVGDRLWVRETWATDDRKNFFYRADGETYNAGLKWKPSIHMPRAASRITLEITGVRVERLQDISEEDAIAEGIPYQGNAFDTIGAFSDLWNSIYGTWDQNPWVWVIELEKVEN